MLTSKNIIDIDDSYKSFIITKNALLNLKDQITRNNKTFIDSISIKFAGMPINEIDKYLQSEIDEHSLIYSFKMIATTEALLRIDYDRRVKNKHKDSLSREFRDINKHYPNKVSLDDHIIDLWIKYYPPSKIYFSEFRRILKERHWIAHGRY